MVSGLCGLLPRRSTETGPTSAAYNVSFALMFRETIRSQIVMYAFLGLDNTVHYVFRARPCVHQHRKYLRDRHPFVAPSTPPDPSHLEALAVVCAYDQHPPIQHTGEKKHSQVFKHVHVKLDAQAVAPVQPCPPHCPHSATLPAPDDCAGAVLLVLELAGALDALLLLLGLPTPEPTVIVDWPAEK